MSHPPLSIAELVLKNADDVVHTFFNGVKIDFKGHIMRWVEKHIPAFFKPKLLYAVQQLRNLGPISSEELSILTSQTFRNAQYGEHYRLYRKKMADLFSSLDQIGLELGFLDLVKYPDVGNIPFSKNYSDVGIFWDEVLPVLLTNKDRMSNMEWKNLHKVLTAERLSRQSIYDIIVDHIYVNREDYKAAAVVAIAGAVSYYLYKLYKSGVSPKQVKAKVIQDSQKIKESAAKNRRISTTTNSKLAKQPDHSSRKNVINGVRNATVPKITISGAASKKKLNTNRHKSRSSIKIKLIK